LRILLSMEHPAWVHQYKYIINELVSKGHKIKILAINKDVTIDLLNAYNIPYEIISNSSGKNIFEKGFIFLRTTLNIFIVSLHFHPDLFLGRASPMMAINSFLFRKPHILFEDTEHSHFCLEICKMFSDVIVTPNCFLDSLGEKQIRIDAYKELSYLWPSYYKPNEKVLEEYGIQTQERYIVVRFVAWNAHHDIGQHGIGDKVRLVKELDKYGRVLITSEGALPEELKDYQIQVSPEKLHDLLYYATLYVGEGGTTATEAAVLGTPSVFISSLVGTMGNFIELENTYGLLYSFISEDEALVRALEILKNPVSKGKWRIKREKMLRDKIDITAFMVWFIENYPVSFVKMKEHLEIQYSYDSMQGDAL
jgi:predicted glycosyltransferase